MLLIEQKGSNKKTARLAGFLYLTVVLSGIYSIAYVPSQIMVRGNSVATVSNIMASESLFRSSIALGFLCYTAFLLLPLVLYKLLSEVNKNVAVLMVTVAVVSVPMSFMNLVNKLNVLTLLSDANYLKAYTVEQLHAQVMLSLAAYSNGILVLQIFWGLWLLPFGYLVFKSGFLPKVLGILLMAGCFSYLIIVIGEVLKLGYMESSQASLITLPATVGEIGTCLWLLIMGAREHKDRILATP